MKRKYLAISKSDPEPLPTVVAPADEGPHPSLPPPDDGEYYYDDDQLLVSPSQTPDLFTRIALFQADLIYNALSLLFSPVSSVLRLVSESYDRAEEAKEMRTTVEPAAAVHKDVIVVPSGIAAGGILLFRRLGMGLLGVAYVCMVLVAVMLASVLIGVGLVRVWVEEPVLVRERLHFDYTDLHPTAALLLCTIPGLERPTSYLTLGKSRRLPCGIPVGHTFQVSVLLLMPDSEYNSQVGVFQLTAELLTDAGQVFARSSQPVMLRFRSLPVRLARVFFLGVPLLLGISDETQKVRVDILKHKEAVAPQTDVIRVALIPRAGTLSPPQLYEAEILIKSQLPWPKKLVRNWKWTFYVWVSLYTYTTLLLVLLCCCKPLLLPGPVGNFRERLAERESPAPSTGEARVISSGARSDREDDDIAELLRKLRQNRRKRRAAAALTAAEAAGSSASSINLTREASGTATTTATSGLAEDDFGDSESVCSG